MTDNVTPTQADIDEYDALMMDENYDDPNHGALYFARHRLDAITTQAAEIARLREEREILLSVMDAADRYNGCHSAQGPLTGRLKGTLMLAIREAYRKLGLSRDDLSRASRAALSTQPDDQGVGK